MPTYDLQLDLTQRQVDKLTAWFPRWNAELAVPYADIQEALVDHLKHQMKAWVQDQDREDSPMENEKWDELTDDQRAAILAILEEE